MGQDDPDDFDGSSSKKGGGRASSPDWSDLDEDDSQSGADEGVWTPRCFVSLPMLHDPHLASVQFATFFHACRIKGVFFDLERHKGPAFNLLDSFSAAVMGLLCVGQTEAETIGTAVEALDFLIKQVGASSSNAGTTTSALRRELETEGNMRHVLSALRQVQRTRPVR